MHELQPYDPTYPHINKAEDYPYFVAYWPESRAGTIFEDDVRHPFFICLDEIVIGFTLIRAPAPYDLTHWQLAEFYIKPDYRRRGVGKLAMQQLLSAFGPHWELQVLALNKPAVEFWQKTLPEIAVAIHRTQPVPAYYHYVFDCPT